MSSRVQMAVKAQVAHPPSWLPDQTIYEVMMGSVAYGVSDDSSDVDVYGLCVPPQRIVFPHTVGVIHGFDKPEAFDIWQEHHLRVDGTEYDFSIFNVVKFMALLRENNPNIVDALFVPPRCVLHMTPAGQIVRDRRRQFLHKGSWHKFRGYAFAQLHKARTKDPTGKRAAIREQFGWDVKFGYHVVRLVCEVEQILTEGDIDLERSREFLKAIRRGERSLEDVEQWFKDKGAALETIYNTSSLRYGPDDAALKQCLLDVLETHYGSLSAALVSIPSRDRDALMTIRNILDTALK